MKNTSFTTFYFFNINLNTKVKIYGNLRKSLYRGFLGGKFLESAARQPELAPQLQVKMFIVAGLIDAIAMIGVAIALFLLFVESAKFAV